MFACLFLPFAAGRASLCGCIAPLNFDVRQHTVLCRPAQPGAAMLVLVPRLVHRLCKRHRRILTRCIDISLKHILIVPLLACRGRSRIVTG